MYKYIVVEQALYKKALKKLSKTYRNIDLKSTPHEALTLIGMLNHQTPDIQEIKAHRDDL